MRSVGTASSSMFSLVLCFLGLGIVACSQSPNTLFEPLPPNRTGVDFENTIVEDDTLLNPLDFEYVYNGGGVGVGDFDGDGRPDLYFAGNAVQNRLYLNEGDWQFQDVTDGSGVAAEGAWSTGVALVDINQDGRLDIYVCVGGPPELGQERANRLYVNQGLNEKGVPTFDEKAEEYGIANTGYSTHAAFFDYDRDGDLDLFLLTTEMQEADRNAIRPMRSDGAFATTDHLYRNGGDGTFTDVSEEAGIQIEGYGLGVAVSDINRDGWPDVYVANDFISNDLLYVNNGDGTFTNRIGEYLQHQSYSSMGVDVADVNNDARNDIFVLDMRPPDRRRDLLMTRFFNEDAFEASLRQGLEPQYVRNMLQINRGPTPDGGLAFSEVGQLAGVDATDWSWTPLLADFDNDGDRDLFVTNGYGKDVTNLDFVERRRRILAFGTEEAQQQELRDAMMELPEVELSNYLFENVSRPKSGAGRVPDFTNRTGEWIPDRPGLSNGAVFADLDSDGDLDLVTNNINAPATLLENHASERDSARSVRVDLHGPPENRRGIGAKVTLFEENTRQYADHSPYRGYQGTVQPVLHFGLGADSTADSLKVVWPDGRQQLLTDVPTGEVVDVRYADASSPAGSQEASSAATSDGSRLFEEIASEIGLHHRHREAEVEEFERTPLLPHKLSQDGPGIAVGDVDGNGLDDVFVGADRGRRPSLFRQQRRGEFRRAEAVPVDAEYEDRGALFFDADGDGDQDLYVVSGGPVRSADSTVYQDRLYLNDGSGDLRRAKDALPEIRTPGSVVTAADYDGDGNLDLFVGGRVRAGRYPLPGRSYLLRNDSETGQVRFTDVTESMAPTLADVGLVTDALWTDYNRDGRPDLMIAGEWMPITVFQNGDGGFTDVTSEVGLEQSSGWWMSLAAGDFDRDGDTDYVAGNLGLNTRYEASLEHPLRVNAKDYNRDGQVDPILTHSVDGATVPVARREKMIAQIPALKRRAPTYDEYAEATFADLFTEEEREGAYVREAVRFETSYLENEGGKQFEVRSLPREVQTAPVFGMEAGDFDQDGRLDLLMVGNWHAPDVRTGRVDAFVGAFLRGDGTGHFSVEHGTESGFFVEGDAKGLARVAHSGDGSLLVATQNGDSLRAFRSRRESQQPTVELGPLDAAARLVFEDGSERRVEFYYGSTYLSQSSRVLRIPEGTERVLITNAVGEQRSVPVNDPGEAGGKRSR